MSTVLASSLPVFPECPGYGFNSQPQYLVNLATQAGGYERADKRWPRPLNVYTAVPIGERDDVEIQAILYFWHAMGGRAQTFLLKDWLDFKSCPTGQSISAIDQPLEAVALTGGGTAYQLTKVYQVGPLTQVREITKPVGSTILVGNETGAVQTAFTVDESTGLLQPGVGFTGTPHSWGGEFSVPVRFDSELTLTIADKQIQSVDFTLREKKQKLATVFGDGSP